MTDSHFSVLSEDSVLSLEGDGIAAFLQGQLTCDTRAAGREASVPGALCNAQGRVVADLRLLLPAPGHGLLRVSAALAEHTATVLGRYAMFSRIAVTDARDHWRSCGLWGRRAAATLRDVTGTVPVGANTCTGGDGWLAVCCDEAGEAFELYVAEGPGSTLSDRLAAAGTGSEADWRARELRRGLLRLGEGQAETRLPQALNYDRAGLVSFRKGCYTGQEVVARLHYRGRAKKRWGLWQGRLVETPQAGGTLTDGQGRPCAEILRSVRDSDGTSWLAALARVEDCGRPLATAAGEPLEPCALPYPENGG